MSDIEPPTKFSPNNPTRDSFAFTTLTQAERADLVELTTSGKAGAMLSVTNLELSALGANATLSGNWTVPPGSPIDLVSWSEHGQGGRTVRSATVRQGYLFPLGHRANYVEVFQRVIAVDPDNVADPALYPVAYLQARASILVTQPVKSYPAPGQPFGPPFAASGAGTTDWPFASVRMVTLDSGNIDLPSGAPTLLAHSTQALWPSVEGTPINWTFVATDSAGHDTPFGMPLVFVYGQDVNNGYPSEYQSGPDSFAQSIVNAYNTKAQAIPQATGQSTTDPPTWAVTGGAPIRLAPEVALIGSPPPGTGAGQGATTHPVLSIALGAATTDTDANLVIGRVVSKRGTNPLATPDPATTAQLLAAGQPNFYPTIRTARLRLHAADVLTGGDFDDQGSDPSGVGGVQFAYYPPYVAAGQSGTPGAGYGGTNVGAVYLQALAPPLLSLPGSSVGGVATPDVAVNGLSASAGLMGGALSQYATKGQALAGDYFASLTAQLLGGLPLSQILADGGGEFQVPVVTSQLDQLNGTLCVNYQLATTLASSAACPMFVPDPPAGQLRLDGTFVNALGQPSVATINGSVDPFTLYLPGAGNDAFLSLHFASLTFSSETGHAPALHVNVDRVAFAGMLSFVNALEEYLQDLGGTHLSVAVSPSAITVSTSIAVPDVSIGVFNLTGLSFSGGVTIPLLDGLATATFAFASPDNPFTLTVAMFGGGGYLTLAVNFNGVQSIQAAFEITGQLAFNIAVASGSLSLSAGVYYSYSTTDGLDLSGFVRVSGQLSVLGIITISAALELQLAYASDGTTNDVTGQASLMVGVSICGFSKSVTVSVTQTFAGSSGGGGAVQGATRQALPAAGSSRRALGANGTSGPIWVQVVPVGNWGTYCGAFATGTENFS
jgi:hypothetical protein